MAESAGWFAALSATFIPSLGDLANLFGDLANLFGDLAKKTGEVANRVPLKVGALGGLGSGETQGG